MTTTLRILLGERWPEPASAHWAVLDPNGQITSTGFGEPKQWPQADRTEVVLHGPQTSWLKIRVPKAGEREQAAALSYSLEEQILREADSQHVTATLKDTEAWHVIVVARDRLKRLISQFEVISRPLDAAYSVLQSLPCPSDAWAIAGDDNGLIVRPGQHLGWVEDLPAAPELPNLLQLAASDARETATLPTRILAYGSACAHPLDDWSRQLGLGIEAEAGWAWYSLKDEKDLLHGEFLPRHRRQAWQRALRPAGMTLVALFLAHIILGTVYAMWRGAELNQINANIEQLMRTQLPNDPVLDPAAQLKRELNLQRTTHGRLAEDSALALLADFATAMGPDGAGLIQSLRYQDGGLDLQLIAGKTDLESLRPRLQARGLTITPRQDAGRISVRRAN